MNVLQQALERLRGGVSRRVEMEMAVLRLCSPDLDASADSLLRRVKMLEDTIKSGMTLAPQAPAAPSRPAARAEGGEPEAPPLPSNEGPSAGDSLGTDQEVPFERWNDVLDTLSGTCPPLYGVLVDSTALLRGDYVLICTDNDMFKALVTRDGNKNVLLGAIRSVTGRNHRIGVKRSSGAPAAGSSAGQAPPPEDPLAAFLQNSRAQGLDVEFKD